MSVGSTETLYYYRKSAGGPVYGLGRQLSRLDTVLRGWVHFATLRVGVGIEFYNYRLDK